MPYLFPSSWGVFQISLERMAGGKKTGSPYLSIETTADSDCRSLRSPHYEPETGGIKNGCRGGGASLGWINILWVTVLTHCNKQHNTKLLLSNNVLLKARTCWPAAGWSPDAASGSGQMCTILDCFLARHGDFLESQPVAWQFYGISEYTRVHNSLNATACHFYMLEPMKLKVDLCMFDRARQFPVFICQVKNMSGNLLFK